MMKLIYKDEYETVDESMSDSNIGARKFKNIRNHIFIIDADINEVLVTKTDPIDIEILDYRQCFDGMWLEEVTNDLYEAGIKNRNLALIYEANKTNQVAVQTPHGLTEKIQIGRIVMHGETLAPLECSVQVDTFGKECLEENKLLYSYRGKVGIPPLALIDDVASITTSGVESLKMNSFLNAKTNLKRLQYGEDKCHKLHVGRKNETCPELFIDTWKVKAVSHVNTKFDLKDEEGESTLVEISESEKYLGDILTADGKNRKNILPRAGKGVGIRKQIMSMLEDVCFGPFFFEVALMYRTSLFLNSILLNSEAWYSPPIKDIEELEKVDSSILRGILEAPRGTPNCMLFLELGCIPIRFLIMQRVFF